MNTAFLTDIRDTILPDRDGKHGPLPPLLLSMTLVTGLVDAFSYLVLGHVFVANMTGNVVFLGFALAGVAGFSVTSSLAAVAAFAIGALLGGKLGSRHGDHRGRLHSSAAAIQGLFLAASVILAAAGGSALTAGYRYSLIAVLGIAMGIQNASARKIAVPDLTTTVLTLTITGIAADSTLAGGSGSTAGRRLTSVATMLIGAFLGAVLIRHTQDFYPLVIALAVIIPGAAASYLLGKPDPAWVRPPTPASPAARLPPATPAGPTSIESVLRRAAVRSAAWSGTPQIVHHVRNSGEGMVRACSIREHLDIGNRSGCNERAPTRNYHPERDRTDGQAWRRARDSAPCRHPAHGRRTGGARPATRNSGPHPPRP